MKSLIRQRREAGAICPICRSPDYSIVRDNENFHLGFNLNIKCNSCGHSWQYGRDGGIYTDYEGRL